MIEPKDLRIGNYVEYRIQDELDDRKEWWELSIIDSTDLQILENGIDDDYRSIPLTEEILLKFGYKKIRDNEFLFDNHFIIFIKESEIDFCLFNSEGNDFFVCEIQFAHELQNLHYSIKKEELTFNK